MIPLEALCSHWVSVYLVLLSVLIRGSSEHGGEGAQLSMFSERSCQHLAGPESSSAGSRRDAQPITPALESS